LATIEELQGYLREAEAARHKVAIGKSVILIRDQNGEQVQFRPTSMRELVAYIDELRAALGIRCSKGPMRMIF